MSFLVSRLIQRRLKLLYRSIIFACVCVTRFEPRINLDWDLIGMDILFLSKIVPVLIVERDIVVFMERGIFIARFAV